MPVEPASSALSRFTVIDLTHARAGPTCARQMGDWGANVIRIDIPEGAGKASDFAHRHNSDFQNLHRNKRSLSLNLKSPEGLKVFYRLVEKADVLVENFRADVKKRLKIDYETLSAINPRLVYTSISGFGQDGPYGDRAGVDQIAQGMGGLMSITGEPGRGPMRVGIAISDMAAGLLAALGTQTALLEREVSGKGQWVTTSLLESQIFMLDFQAVRYLMAGEVPEQVGNDHPTAVPMGCFKALDGHINVAPMPLHFAKFCEVLGRAELAEQAEFATPGARLKNRAMVNETIRLEIQKKDCATWITAFNDAGIPCGPVYSVDQVFEDEQVKHLGIAQEVTSGALGSVTLVGQPVHLSRTDSELVAAAPESGEHNDEVLAWLGYSTTEIEKLRHQGVL